MDVKIHLKTCKKSAKFVLKIRIYLTNSHILYLGIDISGTDFVEKMLAAFLKYIGRRKSWKNVVVRIPTFLPIDSNSDIL